MRSTGWKGLAYLLSLLMWASILLGAYTVSQ
jgi:hypothetical protein